MEQDDPAEALTELRERRLGALELLQAAAGSGLAAYAVWALLLQPGFRRVPLRLQVRGGTRPGAGPGRGARLPLRVSRSGRGRGELRPTSSGSDRERPVDSRRLPVQVPYVGASARQVEHVLSLLRGRPGKTVDLGSGDGRIVLAAHRCGLRPAVGYELNPWLVALARLHAWRAGCAGSVCYRRKDLWKLPLLEDKLRAELPAGARVVSGRFPLPTWQPVAVAGEGLDRVWAYDVPGGGQAGEAVSSRIPIQAAPRPSSASVLGAPVSQAS
ncbi:protein N-lysine methyltransferase FAM173A isoform X2 [Theropithecus gelada]|uniref:Adenine nucleotide translocase lysine methyltransferase n=1 Tax=Theropithecus gelada TaxID=9565 RepID=A0A8D2JXG8_THEGE|nr:protein N-lysine methyltransferase FAM173A isoform X2 [Theropithecus gelada]